MKVLFVCEGNKMRSPMAEALYNKLTSTQDATSAGADPYPIGGEFATTVTVMAERGISLQHGSQLVTPQMVDGVDVVVAFPTPMMPDFVTNSQKTITWDVADPYYQSGNEKILLRRAFDDIERRVKELIANEYTHQTTA